MTPRRAGRMFVLMLLATLAGACLSGPRPPADSPRATQVDPSVEVQPTAGAPGTAATALSPEEPMAAALGLAPTSATQVAVTDWARIRAIDEIGQISDDNNDPHRVRFLADLHQRHATPSFFASAKISRHASVWGWDGTDLVWEATFEIDRTPLHVLRLPDGFDVPALEALFAERGFERTEHAGFPLFSRRIDPRDEWVSASDVAITNTAILGGRRLLVISRNADGIRATLDAAAGAAEALLDEAWAAQTIGAVAGSAAAVVLGGPTACERFWSPYDVREDVWEAAGHRLTPYEAFAIGYDYVDERPVVTIAMTYGDPDDAAADLEPRTIWATDLDVLDAWQEREQLLFEVRPPSDQPSLLFDLSWVDLNFAAC